MVDTPGAIDPGQTYDLGSLQGLVQTLQQQLANNQDSTKTPYVLPSSFYQQAANVPVINPQIAGRDAYIKDMVLMSDMYKNNPSERTANTMAGIIGNIQNQDQQSAVAGAGIQNAQAQKNMLAQLTPMLSGITNPREMIEATQALNQLGAKYTPQDFSEMYVNPTRQLVNQDSIMSKLLGTQQIVAGKEQTQAMRDQTAALRAGAGGGGSNNGGLSGMGQLEGASKQLSVALQGVTDPVTKMGIIRKYSETFSLPQNVTDILLAQNGLPMSGTSAVPTNGTGSGTGVANTVVTGGGGASSVPNAWSDGSVHPLLSQFDGSQLFNGIMKY